MEIPAGFRRLWEREADWLQELPEVIDACVRDWDLELGTPFDSSSSLVIPAGDAVLKLTAPFDREADEEGAALAAWRGRGAVNLLAWNRDRRALLIERCRPGSRLWDAPGDQLAVTVDLTARLTTPVPSDHTFSSLETESARWADEVARRYEEDGGPFERSLLEYALGVYATARDSGYLANQDLHGGNILRSGREPWLAIDPKPVSGEREVSAVGPLRNAAGGNSSDPAAVREYLDAFASIGFDRERSQAWGVAHALAWGYDQQGWNDWSIDVARAIRAA